MPVTQVRELVLGEATDLVTRDRIWRYLVRKARTERGTWYLVALYLVLPTLNPTARRLTDRAGGTAEQAAETQAQLVTEFIAALHRVDLNRAHIASRAADMATYATRSDRGPGSRRAEPGQLPPVGDAERAAPVGLFPPGHPDQVLARLVRETENAKDGHRLTDIEAELIGRTCFEYEERNGRLRRKTLAVAAKELGLTANAATKRRLRAIRLVARLLGRPDLAGPDEPTPEQAE
jgi:hypothetical protein